MTGQKQYVESLEEMVFKNRNKEYGAYVLRKKYSKYVSISLLIALLLIGSLIAYPVIAAYMAKVKTVIVDKDVTADMMEIAKTEAPPPPPPPPPADEIVKQTAFKAPIVSSDTVEETMVSQEDLNAKPSNAPPPTEEEFAPKEEKKQVVEQVEKPTPFTVVEEMPGFPGGEGEMYKFITTTIKYPEEAKELGIQGKVFVNFVVEPDGSISEVKLIRGIGGGCDEEAIRVVRAMPKWIPGKQRGVPVRVFFNLPIKFTLQ
jgi:periplasmic protein TonB